MGHLPRHGSSSPLLLGLIGLGGAAILLFVGSLRASRAAEANVPSAVERAAEHDGAQALHAARRESLPAAPARDAAPEPLPVPTDDSLPLGARGEKRFLAEFVALSPAALEGRASAVLDGDGPEAQKVALLRALRLGGSPSWVAWHEYAVRGGADDSGPQGVGLASTALAVLIRAAELDVAARPALARLGFEAPELAPELRRCAASGYARYCDEDDLARVAVELARSPDKLLVDGMLAELAERGPSAARTRLLLAYGRSAEAGPKGEE